MICLKKSKLHAWSEMIYAGGGLEDNAANLPTWPFLMLTGKVLITIYSYST